ncbi:hypothetical protein GCM10009837_07990 [Streptomyces durmitorensis]|uniref:DUF4352 domain-containing protein n=1 Tax=Streptomyces durmitorensis TaxID=319947 RepID=A0ABY4PMZ6_9ACTN|nr:hypothetical protein [Streptomyces durmitorensis]UQT54313.1 hypothetical protein M4V62_04020 [Streptomyces durmitorensis]
MRVRTISATAVLLLAALTGCASGDDDPDEKSATGKKETTSKQVDCTDEDLSQADWLDHCAEEGTGEDGAEGQATSLKFGETYTYPDGIKVSVVEARVFTDYNSELGESAEPGDRDFRLKIKVINGSKEPFALDSLSTLVEGATNGGEARAAMLDRGSDPLEGRLGAGVTVTKTDDSALKTKYGRNVIVSVQRDSNDFGAEEPPEFSGTIKD